jgi:hypothetical protein
MRRLSSTDEIVGWKYSALAWLDTISEAIPESDHGGARRALTSSDLLERWMVDPSMSGVVRDGTTSAESFTYARFVDVTQLDTEYFNRHFQQGLNTLWQSSLGNSVMRANLTIEDVQTMEKEYEYTWNTTKFTGSRQKGEVYICNIRFATIVTVISPLLFAAGVASLILRVFIKAPDTLGFVSTSARDNFYVTTQVPSHLDGLEAARALQDVRIRIGDVNSRGEVGHVAFASMDAEPKRVSRKRLYD